MNKTIFWISNRLRLSGSSGENHSAGAVIAVIGVALAVMVMEITLCVVAGFKSEIESKIIGFDSQISIGAPYDYTTGYQDRFVTLSDDIRNIIKEESAETSPSLSVSLPAMLKTDDNFAGVIFVAHDSAHDSTFELANIVAGALPDYSDGENELRIVISRVTARDMNLEVGDRVFAYFFADESIKARRVTVAAIYESNLSEYDKSVTYSSLPLLQGVLGVDSITGTHIEINGFGIDEIDGRGTSLQLRFAEAMQSGELERLYPVTTVLQTGAIYFNWLALLDTNVVVIFILMLAVALFTLISSLFLIVLDRIPTIGILRSLGASGKWLTGLFLNLGMRLAIYGIIAGNIFGIGLCVLQSVTGVVKLDPTMYYLNEVPIKIEIIPLIILNIAILIIAVAVLYLPSRSASSMDPTRNLRFE